MTQRQYIRYRILPIIGKLNVSIRISVDPHSEYRSMSDTGENVSLVLYPVLELQIVRLRPMDAVGTPRVWNPNDTLQLSKFTVPLFIRELRLIGEAIKIQEMFVYTNEQLDLNYKLAEEKKRVFQTSETSFVEIIPTVLDIDGKRVEGVRFTFNREPSVFSLTLTELESLMYTLTHVNVDLLALQLYDMYRKTGRSNFMDPMPPM